VYSWVVGAYCEIAALTAARFARNDLDG